MYYVDEYILQKADIDLIKSRIGKKQCKILEAKSKMKKWTQNLEENM